ncbi:MAG: helix-turn-helix domain-containing protein [Oscillospiraceae bacterium]|jgi:transcriptional regulator with XRE-family HTH domain
MFYDNYKKLCEQAGKSESRVLRDLNLSHSLLQRWKNGGQPTNPTKKKLAEYFGITIDELMSPTKKPDTISDVELSEIELEIIKAFRKLPLDKRRFVEELVITLYNNRR